MAKGMDNALDVLARFDGMEWTNVDEKSITFSNGMTVSYDVEVSQIALTKGNPFRAVVKVSRGKGWYTYACSTDEENREVVKWFILKDNLARDHRYEVSRTARRLIEEFIEG
tara:strand:- start:143 stop:478 length:336 start_codon:yes stop_codon:yes gene_type:complete